jgi:hypothetical protein
VSTPMAARTDFRNGANSACARESRGY